MKIFNNFNDANNWINSIIKKTIPEATEKIARQVYVDSKEFTFIDTGTMYDSGKDSNFKGGYVLIKAPQVRKLYYIKCNPKKNKNARIMWFEATKQKNMENYKMIFNDLFNANKK